MQSVPGGYPTIPITKHPDGYDSDHDGLPDAWEDARGLNSQDPLDGAKTGANGYTHLENYLNALAGDCAETVPGG